MKAGRLYLVPVPLGQTAPATVLPAAVLACARRLRHFVAENAKAARVFLKALPVDTPLQQVNIDELNQHTPPDALAQLLAPALAGNDLGLISEAGCPAIADPGADLVALAHAMGVEVVPLVGPSSILLALMASGLSGQSFAFHGYLPSEAGAREQRLRELEKESRQQRRTQIFIETPYRNRQLLASLLAVCAPATRVCIATELTTASELVCTRPIAAWRRQTLPDLNRRPTVFLLHA
ncbi:MAG: SAM-dependent methyltransferase [Candidatus Accumulibacter sp.]|uniref:SAM-dependent methyltransferase n=1 Tax=Accumulibacter sp. TaxID=2053492 RepID=UPI001A4F3885|nr:SAM-dependent methyltransferase [Accumulibacter sp.]MBL8391396.1 SAM-dependent methyltransferase [Accumulibacter sp.]HRD88614.1 SAM-dependent methyltransferase [Accumulibacter sp.]